MKTVTFFNGKGGSGKTTFNVMMASWLCYGLGARTILFDFDSPEFKCSEQRRRDEKALLRPDSELRHFLAPDIDSAGGWYPVRTLDCPRMDPREKEYILDYMSSISGNYDYSVLDFGAGFSDDSPAVHIISSGMVDLVVVPVYSDKAVLESALRTALNVRDWGCDPLVFWNRTVRSERPAEGRDRLAVLSGLFTSRGIDVAGERIGDMTIFRRDSDTWHFIKSTACWPEENIRLMCPALIPLFEEIRQRLDSNHLKANSK